MARYNQLQRDLAYRIYVCDALRIVSENTAKFSGGSHMKTRYIDFIYPKPVDNRSGEEIVADIIGRAGIEVKY